MQSSAWGDFVHPEDRERMAAHLARALAGAEPASADYRIIRADGAERWISYTGQLQQTTEGTRMLGTVVDITERKRIETTLKATRDAAESANQVKDQFLATLSHELRTPLNAILGYARMLQTNAIAPEKRQRAIDIIERNAVAQNQLIEDLLDMSRITRGQVLLEPWPVPVAGVLREAVEGVKPAAEAKRLILDLDIDPFAGTVMADPTRLQQVFWNLLTNAVKFTGQGGRVQASLRHVDNHVEIAVADTGIGIAADFLPHVFEPFRQADARLARGHGGLGLGLAIARQLVELHGGTIAARSAGHGSGATFVVRLPAYAGDDASFARSQLVDIVTSSESVSLAGVDVIVVDDEEDALTLFREALESAGATVRTATSAGDAMREVMARPPNLLVTDLALPGMDGFALLQEIRATHRTVAVVAVTAYARLDDRIRSLEAGFQAHVAKPIDPTLFVRTLAAALCSFSEGEASA
jgi:signal transduction histidine kinase/CheY-like chemotaxis protein